MNSLATDIASDYRPPMCPQCGYSFEGLSAEGSCPECGLAYGPEHIVLFAWPNHVSNAAKYRKVLFAVSAIFFCKTAVLTYMVLLPIWKLILFGPGFRVVFQLWIPLLFLLWFGLVFAVLIWVVLRIRRNLKTMPAPFQIRLSPSGYAIRGGLGFAKIRPWQPTTSFALQIRKDGSPKFVLRARQRWSLDYPYVPVISPTTAAWVATRVQSWIAAVGEPATK